MCFYNMPIPRFEEISKKDSLSLYLLQMVRSSPKTENNEKSIHWL